MLHAWEAFTVKDNSVYAWFFNDDWKDTQEEVEHVSANKNVMIYVL